MITDKKLIFGDAYLPASGDAYFTNEIDFGIANPNQGAGTALWLHVTVGIVFDALTSAIFHLRTGAATDPTAETLISPVFLAAVMIAGARLWEVALPKVFARYARLYYAETGSNNTTGTLNAWIDMTPG
jgi:hypothetical protein